VTPSVVTRLSALVVYMQQFKFHIANLSNVYRGPSQIDNKPYIAPQSRKRPQSAGQRAHTNHTAQWDDSCVLVQDSSPVSKHQQHHSSRGNSSSNAAATEPNTLQQRPQSASVNGRTDSTAAHKIRPQSATPHRSDHQQQFSSDDTDTERVAYQQHLKQPLPAQSAALLASMERTAQTALTLDEQERLNRGYDLSSEESSVYKQFVTFLSSKDPMLQIHILEDAFRDAQLASGLHDYTGPSS
jgi:hypothetical protein